ncbi:MAG TPA: CHAT domain-containing protein [Pyrinomonadaceae bacterium]|nr:CHAT domain-containing protein [Pyrinomonadaceae bacterium]
MKPDSETQRKIRSYLLGEGDEAEREAIERMILTDEELFEELLAVEDEVIDEYLNQKLSPEVRARFENYFLSTPERVEQVQFARAFDRYVSSQTTTAKVETKPSSSRQGWLGSLFSSPATVPIFAVLLLVIGLGTWQIFRQSEVEKGLVALNAAFREERPIEARISSLDYAPFLTKRAGQSTVKVDQNELNRAELTLLEALKQNPSPSVHHALGQVYLARRDFDKAIEHFDAAIRSGRNNSQVYADLGAAWLEKGKLDKEGGEAGKGMEELGRALENFNKVLGLNPNSLEALFNRALCEEQMMLYVQAENDWREYLNRDSTSPWAEEARRRLQLLEEKKKKATQTRDDLFKNFTQAFESRNDDAAWSALSVSRGRTGNAIVESLLDQFFRLSAENSNEEAGAVLQKLFYAGEVEAARVGDHFTRDLARTSREANTLQRQRIAEGRELIKQAIGSYNKSDFKAAIEVFSAADQKFLEGNDECHHMFVNAFIGYCYLRRQEPEKALQIFQPLSEQFRVKNYKSMLAQSLLAQGDALTSKSEFSKALERSSESLALSQQIHDNANSVRCLLADTSVQLLLGDYHESLQATSRALRLAEELPFDPKITWPFYHEASLDFYLLGLPTSALLFEREALRLAITADLHLQASRSYDRLALLQEHLGRFADAMTSSELARAEGQKITDERMRTNVFAHAAMNLGRLYRETGEAQKAIASFDTALSLYTQLGMDIYRYPVHKGKMLALMQLNDNAAAQAELDSMLYWFEQHREKIAEERFRNKFFDTEQDAYDLAIDFAYSRNNDGVKALDFAELSRARSLHDLMTNGAHFSGGEENPELKLTSVTPALSAKEIQNRVPEHTQLLEYSVLRDKTVIWVITRNSINPVATTITRDELNKETERYLALLTSASPDRDAVTRQAKKLYAALIEPAEAYLTKNRRVCIIPDDKLSFLPFPSLVSPDTGKYLIEDYTLQIAPSATVFITTSENAKLRQPFPAEKLLIVGNPRFDRKHFADLPDLPSAKREAEQIATLYGGTPLTGDAAIVSRVRSALTEADVIHFATHAVPDDKSPLLSKLLLAAERSEMHHPSSAYITAADIYRMKLTRARLVVLSACQTGVEKTYRGEGAIGLARPFIAAGVPLVVASLWPVESDETANFMISFHKHRKQGRVSTVEALRGAQLEALRNPQSKYGWAAFVLIGGEAAF